MIEIGLKWLDIASGADMIHMIKENEMSEFTEKLNSSELVSKAWDEIDRDQACAGLLIDTISNEFKDWQPPKPLVKVPKIVADYIETQKGNDYNGNASLIVEHYDSFKDEGNDSELDIWIAKNFNDFLSAIVNGYTVEKEKTYYLKNKITNQYINMNPYNGHCHESMVFGKCYKCAFTQSEIDDMETGSYEKIEVEP